MVDVEVKTEYKVRRKSGAADELDNAAADKVKAGAEAMVKKVTDPKKRPSNRYNVEKAKERLH
jgi:hypothetical protein